MRDALVILAVLLLLAVSLVTGLFQSVPTADPAVVFSPENILSNVIILLTVIAVFCVYYLVRALLPEAARIRIRRHPRLEGYLLVISTLLIFGLVRILGILEGMPLLEELDAVRPISQERIWLYALSTLGIALLVSIFFLIRTYLAPTRRHDSTAQDECHRNTRDSPSPSAGTDPR